MAKQNLNFEQQLQELEKIVNAMETTTPDLDAALKQFEKGIALARECETKLKAAEQKIKTISHDTNNAD